MIVRRVPSVFDAWWSCAGLKRSYSVDRTPSNTATFQAKHLSNDSLFGCTSVCPSSLPNVANYPPPDLVSAELVKPWALLSEYSRLAIAILVQLETRGSITVERLQASASQRMNQLCLPGSVAEPVHSPSPYSERTDCHAYRTNKTRP
jgi:hypothetical protein